MLKHTLLIIYRNFQRFKSSFLINLIGLSTGLTCSLLIYLWVSSEWKMDKFHEKSDRLYQVMESKEIAGGTEVGEGTAGLLAETLAAEIPEIEYSAAVIEDYGLLTISAGDKHIKERVRFAGKDFFSIFSYQLLQGVEKRVLADKNSIAISESVSKKLFGNVENIIGKTIILEHDRRFIISGIFKDTPSNSSKQFDFVVPFEAYKSMDGSWVLEWNNYGPSTYIVLKEGTNPELFNAKIKQFMSSKVKSSERNLFIRPFSEGYLYNKYENGIKAGGRIEHVKLFAIIAVFILLIACFNFMNLSTAKASRRLKEVGVKKTLGANRETLIIQYLGESFLITLSSVITALLLALLLLPVFNSIVGKQLEISLNAELLLSALLITALTALFAGSYPALYLSGFKPIAILKGKIKTSTGELLVRKGLVVLQFTLSVIFIAAVIVVHRQIEYVKTKNLGYDKENLIHFQMEGNTDRDIKNFETFISEVKNIPGVINASSIGNNIVGEGKSITGIDYWPGKDADKKIDFNAVGVYYQMLETLGVEMKEGRTFSQNHASDNAGIIFNEAAIKIMGLKNPIGQTVKFRGTDRTILGVAKDFHFESLHEKVKPVFFTLFDNLNKFVVRIQPGKEKDVIEKLNAYYKEFNPDFPLEYKFVDQEYQAKYQAEQTISVLSKYFAAIAILISCLGIFGLSAFTAERRQKEIGIRKVLGASNLSAFHLLSGEFSRLVFTAIIIALPLSYLIINHWLNAFAYRIDLNLWHFVAAGFGALVVAWLTVGFQVFRAAFENPITSLRSE